MASNGGARLLASAPEDAEQQELQLTSGKGAGAQADANGAAGSSASSSGSGAGGGVGGGGGGEEGEELERSSRSSRPRPLLLSVRFAIALLGFFGTLSLYSLRVNLSIALPCMVYFNTTDQYRTPNMSTREELHAVCQVALPSSNTTDPSEVRQFGGSTCNDQ